MPGTRALHHAVLGYDDALGRIEREMLVLNIARAHRNLPGHFSVASSVAATFDYRANAQFGATINAGTVYSLTVGASAAESPTVTVIPITGQEFTTRILAPLDEAKLQFLLYQGARIDMLVRLMAEGLELRRPDGGLERMPWNAPGSRPEYEEFRRVAMHLGALQAENKLFGGALVVDETVLAQLTGPLSPGKEMAALERGWPRPARECTC